MTYVLSMITVVFAILFIAFGVIVGYVAVRRLRRDDTPGDVRITAKNFLIIASASTIIGAFILWSVITRLVDGSV